MSRKLKPKQKMAALLLAQGHSGRAISGRLKMRPETLSRWKRLPEFNDAIERVMADDLRAVHHRIQHLAEASVSAIWGELQHPTSSSVRVNTALKVITMASQKKFPAPEGIASAPVTPNP